MLGKLTCYATKLGIFLTVAALIAGMAGCGDGGYNPPPSKNLEIRTWYDLDAVRDNLAGNHTLLNDLNSTTPGYEELASPTANAGKGWEPVGRSIGGHGPIFTGTFDGQGHEIRDLFISRPDEDAVGLFGDVGQEGVIENIGVVNVTVTGRYSVGALAAGVEGTLGRSYSSGSIAGDRGVGGLVGDNFGTVSNSYSTGSITGDYFVGGLVGLKEAASVSNSYSTGNVTGNSCVGGLVGANLVGPNEESGVTNSYSTGDVTGNVAVGGLVGDNQVDGDVSNSHSTGSVTGVDNVGGLVGLNEEGTVSNSFWDTETSGQASSDGGTGKNTTEMQDIATFTGAGWNIIGVANPGTRNPVYIWNIVDGVTYPFLSWQV